MSALGEVVGIVACVANIVSIYHDAGRDVQRIKTKRAEKHVPAPPRLLDEAIDTAPAEIEKEKQRGINRFGQAFDDGDDTAVVILQEIATELQSNFLEKLRDGTYVESKADFTGLVDAADEARDRTIGVLLELRQRLLHGGTTNNENQTTSNQQSSSLLTPNYKQGSIQNTAGSFDKLSALPAKLTRRRTRESSVSREASDNEDANAGANDGAGHSGRRHRGTSILSAIKNHQEEKTRRHSPSIRSTDSSELDHATFMYEAGEDNRSETWGSRSRRESQRRNNLSIPSSNTRTSRSASNLVSSAEAMRSLATIASGAEYTGGSKSVPQPNPENDWLGFCKGAVSLQNGDRKAAMQKTREFNDGWSSSAVYFLSCSNNKCCFAGHMDLDLIWTKVFKMAEDKGIRFRWTFLAKSHVVSSKVKDNQFAYQCLFCAFSGNQTPVIQGTDLYLDHISQEHRGRIQSDVVLYKTGCVIDRICDDSEDFDINLFPLTIAEHAQLNRQSEVLSDDLIVSLPSKKGSDAKDSMFSDEPSTPWNEGLSEFHYDDDFECTEREYHENFISKCVTME